MNLFEISHYFCIFIWCWWWYRHENPSPSGYLENCTFSSWALSLLWGWCVCICASTYECHRNEWQWCPGRCSGVPAAPSSLAWCQVSRVSRCLGEKPEWTINPHYIPMKGWPGKMWGTAERTHPKRVNTSSKDDSSLYSSSGSFWSPADVWPRNKQISFLVSAYIETNFP